MKIHRGQELIEHAKSEEVQKIYLSKHDTPNLNPFESMGMEASDSVNLLSALDYLHAKHGTDPKEAPE